MVAYQLHTHVNLQLQAEVKVHSETVNSLRTELEQAQQEKHEKVGERFKQYREVTKISGGAVQHHS